MTIGKQDTFTDCMYACHDIRGNNLPIFRLSTKQK